MNKNSKNEMIESVSKSLDKLNINCLNLCYLHQNDMNIISDPYIHEGILELKQKNLILHSGTSIYSQEELNYSLESNLFDYVQVPMNIIDLKFYNSFIKKNSDKISS